MKRLATTLLVSITLAASAAACVPAQSAMSGGTAGLTVKRVIDGDTVELSTGQKVRLIGIDTPEVGTGHSATQATARMSSLVLNQPVTVVPGARDDSDRYGRLLRYIDNAGRDAGQVLIEEGLAIARYDSRDGYGRHTRQDSYVAADLRTPNCV